MAGRAEDGKGVNVKLLEGIVRDGERRWSLETPMAVRKRNGGAASSSEALTDVGREKRKNKDEGMGMRMRKGMEKGGDDDDGDDAASTSETLAETLAGEDGADVDERDGSFF